MSDRTRVRRMFWLFAAGRARIAYFMVMAPTPRIGIPSRFNATASWRSPGTCSTETGSAAGASDLLPAGHLVPTAARSPLPVLVFAAALGSRRSFLLPPAVRLVRSGVVAVCAYRIARGRQAVSGSASGRESSSPATCPRCSSPRHTRWRRSRCSRPACRYVLLLIRAADRPGLGIAAAGAMLGLTALSRPTVLWPWWYRWRGCSSPARPWCCLRPRVSRSPPPSCLRSPHSMPWVVRNYRVFGDPIVTTTLGGFNLTATTG